METPMRISDFVYKIASVEVHRAFVDTGVFPGMPIDIADGYVHFSTAAQLRETLRLHFAGRADLVVFSASANGLGTALRWEPSRGGQLFPHLYGELPITAVGEHATISVAADGAVVLPDWVR
jgi:uncharacterized protein (DUF952 family)